MLLDQLLDQLRSEVGSAEAGSPVDAAATEVVGVLATVASGRDAIGQTVAALAAVDAAPQIVLADPWALSSDPLGIQQALHLLEGVRVNQRLVPTLECLLVLGAPPVDDYARVVGIAEQALDYGRAELLRHPFGGWARAQTQAIQLVSEFGDRVFARGIELEGEGDEPSAIWVDGHDGDPSSVRKLVNAVEVAERRRTVGAANARLLVQASFDVLAGLHRLELVLSSDHALVQERGGAVVANHRLRNGDQLGSCLPHQLAGLPVVALVACPPAQAPDDHVFDASRGVLVTPLQVIKHRQKACALVQVHEGRPPRIAVLVDDRCLKCCCLFFGTLALGVDGQTVVAVVGPDLSLGGHPQIGKGSCGRCRSWCEIAWFGWCKCWHTTSFLGVLYAGCC
ncbi:MAG TPA: hypothetical protein VK680_12125 [Solirubrobacteraceae bacterium]|nr:hypothetical protein [Solirubrobacteraceae bacterium]